MRLWKGITWSRIENTSPGDLCGTFEDRIRRHNFGEGNGMTSGFSVGYWEEGIVCSFENILLDVKKRLVNITHHGWTANVKANGSSERVLESV